ncbi:MAG: heat-inducible transcriptional repressor HrcA [Christensenellaceae bacterium]|jgi:heat-inducible transcriptional repressor|nr:heat-inducible transcriptional repressor HrcA [Christensenellaceae bacterium]
MSLDDRKFRILQAIIDDYILTAMPVGSRTISKKGGMTLSSATIRNEMSDLEELGYLDQPHTSSGRVPSWKAYRLYVDRLLQVASLPPEESARVKEIFKTRMDQMEDVFAAAARAISELTDYAGVLIAPRAGRVQRVQLVPITANTALMVTVTDNGIHKDSVVPIPGGLSPDHLYMISNVLTERAQGHTIAEILPMANELLRDMGLHRAFFLSLLDRLARQMEPDSAAVVVGSASKLLAQPEFSDIERARGLLSALETKDQLARLLSARSQIEFSITIGPELMLDGMQNSSLVTMSYSLGGGAGAMGVIGPSRMQYGRVLGILSAMRQALNEIDEKPGKG